MSHEEPISKSGYSYDLSESAMATLLETSRVLGSALELMELMQASISRACDLTGLQTGAIYLVDGDTVHLQATEPPLPLGFPEALLSAPLSDHPHMEQCLNDGDFVRIDDVAAAPLSPAELEVCTARQLKSLLLAPLQTEAGLKGAFIVGATDASQKLAGVDLAELHALASHVALAITNAELHETLTRANIDPKQTYDDALTGWATALDMRDHVTGGHSVRVEELTIRLATALGLPSGDIEHVRRGVLLHDVGKMILPDAILMKAGPLSEDEWAIMREHPKTARDFMGDIEFLIPAMDIPYSHHERWDGTGYPEGLSGEDIPLTARIFAVVDVYDALTSNRPYRDAWSKEDAIDYIKQGAGSHFDSDVVDVFLKVVSENPTY